ncbi:MAG: hypothetical protein BAA01_10815 [Bacillus thermozeamaize]|uniref:Uncharacterized protein n=1 Tax=Bacillus thermozeamaize TaxID=230954 RepID=A0A1Y3PS05_9BACI|nr:MAG: hypothetical protein BAA01_10815 [Bacillus thermozeamaize]
MYLSEEIKIGEEVRFQSNGVTISGSLVKPDTDEPTPAIVAITKGSARKRLKRNGKPGKSCTTSISI